MKEKQKEPRNQQSGSKSNQSTTWDGKKKETNPVGSRTDKLNKDVLVGEEQTADGETRSSKEERKTKKPKINM